MNTRRDRPNVVICLCDQLRAFDVGCYGDSEIRTPNIDKLASEGVRFETACSNNPVCTPARSILLSGQYSRTCAGSLVNVAEPIAERDIFPDPTIAEAFKSAGYRTGLIGKWHVRTHPTSLGFETAYFPHHSHRYTGQTYFHGDGRSQVVADFAPQTELTELHTFLQSEDQRPFFLYYNICQPHMPLDDIPEIYSRMYAPESVKLRPNTFDDGKPAFDENWFKIYLWDYLFYQKHLPYTEALPAGFDLRHLTALYRGSITWADDQLGELMRELGAAGLDENTIVVFTSDHGDNLGSHQLFNKDVLYEESTRIPMIFRSCGDLAPRMVSTQVASLVDVMPTLLSLAGADVPHSVQGTDLSSVVRGREDSVGDNAAFIETSLGPVGIRTLTHLYGINKAKDGPHRSTEVTDDRYMLFDLASDPLQMDNQAGSAGSESLANELRERLLSWDRETPWMAVE